MKSCKFSGYPSPTKSGGCHFPMCWPNVPIFQKSSAAKNRATFSKCNIVSQTKNRATFSKCTSDTKCPFNCKKDGGKDPGLPKGDQILRLQRSNVLGPKPTYCSDKGISPGDATNRAALQDSVFTKGERLCLTH